jgi:EmrB/QacA subfamily drug resistance transporter
VSTTQPAAAPQVSAFDPALRRLALVVVLGAAMTILDTTIVNVAIGTLGRAFHAPLQTIQWVLTGYTLALAMAIPITGWAVQRFGGKRMWITSLALFITGSVLCGAAWSTASLIAFRVLQGIGGGMLLPIGQTMLARAAGPARMGRVMSVIAVPTMLAPVLGPVLGGLIVDHLDWRWMFYVNVPICAFALVLAVRLLPADTEREPGHRLDTVGLALLSPGLALLVYGLSEAGGADGLHSTGLRAGLGLGLALIAAFGWHALRRTDRPLLDLRLFGHRPFSAATATLCLYSGAVFGLMILLPLYFQLVRHASPLTAGLLLAPLGLGAMATMPVSGRLTDRYGPRGLATTGLVVALAGTAAFTQLDAETGTGWLVGAVFVVGLGHGLLLPAMMAAAYRGLDRSAVPAATTAFSIVLRIAGSFGTAVLAVVLQARIRVELPGASGSLANAADTDLPAGAERLAHAFAHSFWWSVAIAAAALLPMLLVSGRNGLVPDPS